MARRIYDVSRPVSERLPVWPSDPPVELKLLTGGDGTVPVVRHLSFSSHAGTHVDPPAHFIVGGRTVEQLSLETLIGPAWLIHYAGDRHITAADLDAAGIPDGVTRLLVRTRNSERAVNAGFDPEYLALSLDAARWVLDRGIRLVGVDGPSVAPLGDEMLPVHVALLGAEVILLESLMLAEVEPGAYDLICLPLPVVAGDGAPARTVLVSEA
jgi:arylformamidase